jgi:hypothetical protein
MFNGLNNEVQTDENTENIQDLIRWSIRNLCKDDRIIWYLSLVRRYLFFSVLKSGSNLAPKLQKKITKKLRGWTEDRIQKDYLSFSRSHWEHFENFRKAFHYKKMDNYSFWDIVDNECTPRPALTILRDFKKMEQEFSFKNERFCQEGVLFLELKNGWGWYLIEKGFSMEEARAMKHCGNGSGKKGDKLLSLRESVKTFSGTFLKPHLTFILNRGYLLEMKGFANQKPDRKFHPYIKELLLMDEIKGLRGGGYLPENNFHFFDFDEPLLPKIIDQKKRFSYDLFGEGGREMVEVPQVGRWSFFGCADCSEEVMARYGINQIVGEPNWLVFQINKKSGDITCKRSVAWCSFENGMVGKIHIEEGTSLPNVFSILLNHSEIQSISEPLLTEDSSWSKYFDLSDIEKNLIQKPGFFRETPLDAIYKIVGCSEGFLSVVNHQVGLDTCFRGDCIELISFANLSSFARRTGMSSLIRKVKNFDSKLQIVKKDIFRLGWLTLSIDSNSNQPLSLHIRRSEMMRLLKTLQVFGKTTPKELIQKMIRHYGPPQLFERQTRAISV